MGSPTLFFNESSPEQTLSFELIVRTTAQAEIANARLSSTSQRLFVVVLEELSGFAAMPVGAHVRASAAVALLHGALHVGWDVTGVR